TVYGFMRAESAFNAQARSSAGALGLMQLMPATARYTAAKIGIGPISTAKVLQPEINVKLGTAYLRQMLDRFDGHLVMAAAAYNAGPNRVTQWQPSLQCMPAELWIELIPFTETRKYVRNILFYTAIYQWRMGQRVKPLATRLAAIAPKLDNGIAHLSCISRVTPLVTAD
ncbi:MAG TPA: lytic transglycosylase domain-containing protein, partial [Gammaproteobacteria bacterium]|nr:lytic transglycosylase domain-containing protein [Gammaproteobacteria bacterium]